MVEIMKYTIEESNSIKDLIDKVTNRLELDEGWEIVKEGFKVVSIEHEDDKGVYVENMFYQVMIKNDKADDRDEESNPRTFRWD